MFTKKILPLWSVILGIIILEIFNSFKPKHPLAGLEIEELVIKYGYSIETHTVITDDGYILSLHRIPYGKNQTETRTSVLLMHGFAQSAQDYVNLGPNNSLALLLADRGFDVWLGNARGSTRSRKHQILDSNKDQQFWNYSLDEIALYDLPAFISYILRKTQQLELQYIGYSQGTTIFFMLMSERPEFQTKIQLMTALAPAIFLKDPQSPFVSLAIQVPSILELFFDVFNYLDFMSRDSLIAFYLRHICNEHSIFVNLCLQQMFMLHGYSYEEVNKTELSLIFSNTPAGTSPKQFMHIGQLMASGNIQKYDYRIKKNLQIYGSINPPVYDVTKIFTPVAIYYSENDWAVNIKNIEKIMQTLPNAIKSYQVPLQTFNHNDFINAKNVVHLLYNEVVDEMLKFCQI